MTDVRLNGFSAMGTGGAVGAAPALGKDVLPARQFLRPAVQLRLAGLTLGMPFDQKVLFGVEFRLPVIQFRLASGDLIIEALDVMKLAAQGRAGVVADNDAAQVLELDGLALLGRGELVGRARPPTS